MEIGKIKLIVGKNDEEVKVNLEERLAIDQEDLNSELSNQPSEFARFAVLAARAKSRRERIDYELEEYENKLDISIREGATKEDGLTEGKIKALVRIDSKRLAVVNTLIEAKEIEEIAIAAKEAFSQRKDCLISLGANRRAEMDTDLYLKERKKK